MVPGVLSRQRAVMGRQVEAEEWNLCAKCMAFCEPPSLEQWMRMLSEMSWERSVWTAISRRACLVLDVRHMKSGTEVVMTMMGVDGKSNS